MFLQLFSGVPMKKVFFVFIILSSLFVFGCNFGKPAYSDVQVDNKTKGESQRGEQSATQNANQSAAASEDPIAKAEREAGLVNGQQNPQQEKKEMTPPSFLVPGSSEIKDLPRYKRSQIVNAQYGPLNGVSSAMLVFSSPDTVDKIGAFYESAFKSNGWTVITNLKDPENFEYTLRKGARDEALVRIRKDTQSGSTVIMLSRAELPPDQSVTSAPLPPAPQNKK
jgi:hypothetical protein